MQRYLFGVVTALTAAQALAFNPYTRAYTSPTWPVSVPQRGFAPYPRPYVPFSTPRPGWSAMVPPPAVKSSRPQPRPAAAAQKKPRTESPTQQSDGAPDSQTRFIRRLLPLIADENVRLTRLRKRTAQLVQKLERSIPLTNAQRTRLTSLARKYRVDGNPLTEPGARLALLRKVDVIPASLALAQAANESAWGKSRFAREGNNLFGIWTFDESKGMVPLKRAAGKKHLVRRFDSEADSIRYYMFTLNSHPAYDTLRDIRARLRSAGKALDGTSLADGLTAYSAKGTEYVRLIKQMIGRFDLAGYDAGDRDRA